MSKAKDEYYEFKKEADPHHEGLCDKSFEYILELEQQKAELISNLEIIAEMLAEGCIITSAEFYAITKLKKYSGE